MTAPAVRLHCRLAWQDAPACGHEPSATTSSTDLRGRLWGFELERCALHLNRCSCWGSWPAVVSLCRPHASRISTVDGQCLPCWLTGNASALLASPAAATVPSRGTRGSPCTTQTTLDHAGMLPLDRRTALSHTGACRCCSSTALLRSAATARVGPPCNHPAPAAAHAARPGTSWQLRHSSHPVPGAVPPCSGYRYVDSTQATPAADISIAPVVEEASFGAASMGDDNSTAAGEVPTVVATPVGLIGQVRRLPICCPGACGHPK
jgi:hypothetical protein